MLPPDRASRFIRFRLAWLIFMALAAAGLVAACSPGRGIEALQVLQDVSSPATKSGGAASFRRINLRYRIDGRLRSGDLYMRRDAKAGLVLVPGAARAGKDDPRLTAFARSLARARFAVLVPDIENVRRLRLGPEDATDVADAVRHLAKHTGTGGVGLVAISYAAGPAVLAALDTKTRDHVRFILAVGGYYDIEAAVTFFTTGNFRDPASGKWRYRRPNAYGKWVFVRGNAARLRDPADRIAVAAMAERKLRDPRAGISDIVRRLGAEGRAIHNLLANRDPDRVPALIAALPRSILDDIRALDLKRRDLGGLSARLFLVHGRDDPIIPHSETLALAAAAGASAKVYLVDNMGHADIGPPGLGDTFTLWRAVYAILEERDTMIPPSFTDVPLRPTYGE